MRPNVIRLTLSDAESLRAYNLSGTALTLRSASAPFATVSVSLDDSSGPWLTLRQGEKIPVAFDRLYLKWDAQPGQWVELVEGDGWETTPTPEYLQRLLKTVRSGVGGTAGPLTCYTCPAGKMAIIRSACLLNLNNNWNSIFTLRNELNQDITTFEMLGNQTTFCDVKWPLLLKPGWHLDWLAAGFITSQIMVFVEEY